jgi:hypothetical protein
LLCVDDAEYRRCQPDSPPRPTGDLSQNTRRLQKARPPRAAEGAAENVRNTPTVVCQCEVERPLLQIADTLSQAGLRLLTPAIHQATQLLGIAPLRGQLGEPPLGLFVPLVDQLP